MIPRALKARPPSLALDITRFPHKEYLKEKTSDLGSSSFANPLHCGKGQVKSARARHEGRCFGRLRVQREVWRG